MRSRFRTGILEQLKRSFPRFHILGCPFPYAQSIFRKVQALGSANSYTKDSALRQEVKMLFALPLLPQRAMLKGFEEMEANADPRLSELMVYMRSTWLNSSVPSEPALRDRPSTHLQAAGSHL